MPKAIFNARPASIRPTPSASAKLYIFDDREAIAKMAAHAQLAQEKVTSRGTQPTLGMPPFAKSPYVPQTSAPRATPTAPRYADGATFASKVGPTLAYAGQSVMHCLWVAARVVVDGFAWLQAAFRRPTLLEKQLDWSVSAASAQAAFVPDTREKKLKPSIAAAMLDATFVGDITRADHRYYLSDGSVQNIVRLRPKDEELGYINEKGFGHGGAEDAPMVAGIASKLEQALFHNTAASLLLSNILSQNAAALNGSVERTISGLFDGEKCYDVWGCGDAPERFHWLRTEEIPNDNAHIWATTTTRQVFAQLGVKPEKVSFAQAYQGNDAANVVAGRFVIDQSLRFLLRKNSQEAPVLVGVSLGLHGHVFGAMGRTYPFQQQVKTAT